MTHTTSPRAKQLEQQFERWLDGGLSAVEAEQLLLALQQEAPALAEQMQVLAAATAAAEDYEAAPVPAWNRESTWQPAYHAPATAWWQRPWLPLASLACSLLAVAAVLLQLQIQVTPAGTAISFGGEAQATALVNSMNAQLDARLQQFAETQQQQLAQYTTTVRDEFRDDLTLANAQLVNYVLATSRTERQEDFADLIEYVNAQRQDDQVFYVNQIRQLQQTVGQPTSSYDLGPYRAAAQEE